MDLTEAEDIKKRWQEYTEELYKKDLHCFQHRSLSHCNDTARSAASIDTVYNRVQIFLYRGDPAQCSRGAEVVTQQA